MFKDTRAKDFILKIEVKNMRLDLNQDEFKVST
jgi:hypothetical protein